MKAPRDIAPGGLSLCILVPVLRRPHRVAPLLESIEAATPEPHHVLFIADEDDTAEITALDKAGAEYLALSPPVNYAAKINAGYRASTESLFFMAADDLDFHAEWFRRAASYLSADIDVVGTNDLCNPRVMCGQHSTHTLVRRSYIESQSGVIDEPDTVLHEGYKHEYCDDEFVQTAQSRGCYAHAFDALVEHLHPLVEKAPDDETYELGRAETNVSRRLFRRRKRLWQT
jgi:glycosyltransferase involved in cell wall biosynthesis